jgi:hypothetical protein
VSVWLLQLVAAPVRPVPVLLSLYQWQYATSGSALWVPVCAQHTGAASASKSQYAVPAPVPVRMRRNVELCR